MGYKYDQNPFPSTYRHQEQAPPPLPPRSASIIPIPPAQAPPPYSEGPPVYHSQPLTHSWSHQDPRSSSTQSLLPYDSSDGDGKRTLLLVYIHGFMGNETSFQSFPAHVHNLVTVKLEDSHVVHTKIYPKYKSRKAISFARDGFSEWLRPHESPNTDVVLLGHSMGGLLSAEVALLENYRILGTINFDTPFLGMHPGVVASGLGSLFKPAPYSPAPKSEGKSSSQDPLKARRDEEPHSNASSSYFGPDATSTTLMPAESSSTTTLPISPSHSRPMKDPNYDPPFSNDVRSSQRTGWSSALHFLNKHSADLRGATQSYVKSHFEFGGAMADFSGLKIRYTKIRALENAENTEDGHSKRIRFVNYYTASTGRPRIPKRVTPTSSRTQTGQSDGDTCPIGQEMQNVRIEAPGDQSPCTSPRISIEYETDPTEDTPVHRKAFLTTSEGINDDEGAVSEASEVMDHLHPAPVTDNEMEGNAENEEKSVALIPSESTTASEFNPPKAPPTSASDLPPSKQVQTLPPVPPAPEEPPNFDPNPYYDKDTRNLAEKEHARQVKAYKQAIKDRDKAISDRRKLVGKWEKSAAKEREKLIKVEEKERVKAEQRGMEKGEKERAKTEKEELSRIGKERVRAAKSSGTDDATALPKGPSNPSAVNDNPNDEKAKRDKKFCMLPPMVNGLIDRCWIRVFMPGVDQVGAHCGLFLVDGERYEWFVNDVAERIEQWLIEKTPPQDRER